MKHWVYLLGAGWLVLSLLLSCGSKDAPFISDAGYRQQVEADFLQKQALMPEGNLFAIFQTHLTNYEREALEFLYAYMPLADITDYPGEVLWSPLFKIWHYFWRMRKGYLPRHKDGR